MRQKNRKNLKYYISGADFMNINDFFEKLTSNFGLGKIINKPSRVSGGLTHKMYKITTDKSKNIIKLLNPNIMKRPSALGNFENADKYEEILKANNIDAIYSLKFNGKKLQIQDNQYFYVYDWYDGKSLKDCEIKKGNCEKIGRVLSEIHNITLKEDTWREKTKNINWQYYIDLAKDKKSPIYDMLFDKIDILNDSMNKGNEVVDKLPNYIAVCHNDLDSKNVLWLNDNFKIIDLECLGYSNPYLELFTLALCWSGYESYNVNFELFKVFINSYFENSKLSKNVNWEALYYANNGRLEWLEYNIKRSLMLETDSLEEQQLGISEVKETIDHIIYYHSLKDEILKNCT